MRNANIAHLPAVSVLALLAWMPCHAAAQQGAPDIDQLERQLKAEIAKHKGAAPAPTPEPEKAASPAEPTARWRAAEAYTGPLKIMPVTGARASFMMGDPTDDALRANARPAHSVQLRPYVLAERTVTRGQFQRFAAATGYKTDAERAEGTGNGCVTTDLKTGLRARGPGHSWRDPGFRQSDDHPAVCISWNDAQAYIRWLNTQTQLHFRLPTEAEWEYAARAGAPAKAPLGWATPGTALTEEAFCRYENTGDQTLRIEEGKLATPGTVFHHRWVHCQDGYVYTAPVAKFEVNPFGLHDMNGNVSTWVQDCWHENFTGAPADGSAWEPTGAGSCNMRVIRGSNWVSWPVHLDISQRWSGVPANRSDTIGFRLALTP